MKFIAVFAAIMIAASSVDGRELIDRAICAFTWASRCQSRPLPELLNTPLAELCKLRTKFAECFISAIEADCEVQLKTERSVFDKVCANVPAFEGPLECLRKQRGQTVPLIENAMEKIKQLLVLEYQSEEEIGNTVCCGVQTLKGKFQPIVDKCKSNDVFEALVEEVVHFGSNAIDQVVKMTPDCCEHIPPEAKAIIKA